MKERLVDVVDLGAGVVALVLDRARKRNALSSALLAALAAELTRSAAQPDCRIIVLAARGPVFSAGADVADVRTAAIGELGSPERLQAECQDMIGRIGQPVIACVEGDVIGGAVGLVASADIVIANAGAHFVLPEARLGLAPTLAAPPLVSRIGRAAATRLMLLGDRVGAQDCRDMGLVTICVEPGGMPTALEHLLTQLLTSSPAGLAACKALARSLGDHPRRPSDPDLFHLTANLVASTDARAARDAAALRMPPPWSVASPSAARIARALADAEGL